MRITRLFRALVVAFGLLQAGTPTLAAFAEATLGSSPATRSHVEDQTQRNCAPVHADDCTLCRALVDGAPPQRAQLIALDIRADAVRACAVTVAAIGSTAQLPPSRAPPQA